MYMGIKVVLNYRNVIIYSHWLDVQLVRIHLAPISGAFFHSFWMYI